MFKGAASVLERLKQKVNNNNRSTCVPSRGRVLSELGHSRMEIRTFDGIQFMGGKTCGCNQMAMEPRPTRTRLREAEARILALRIAATMPNLEATTTQIKELVPQYVAFTQIDLEPSDSRNNELKWQQVVGNVISHQHTGTSIFTKGYAIRTEDGLRVTPEGLAFLESLDEL